MGNTDEQDVMCSAFIVKGGNVFVFILLTVDGGTKLWSKKSTP